MGDGLHLAVALDGAGDARHTPGYWVDLVREAERGLLDLVTIEDDLGPDGRLDAVLVAARVAPLTSHIGLVPTVVTTHTEPFHVSKAIATLDYVSTGRAGVRVKVSADPGHAGHFGRREVTPDDLPALLVEAADHVEAQRRLWDSWEDDAEIRDVATGRFVDRDKLHYVDFEGDFFSVKGPSITPRPPQGQPPVAVLSHEPAVLDLARRAADIVFTTPHALDEAVAHAADAAPLHHFADLAVDFGGRTGTGSPDALVFTGTPAGLADLLAEWHAAGVRGFRLRPASLPDDLSAIVSGVVPELQRRGLFRTAYTATTLRGHLGLPRPANRYAA
ncbi:LLM class flavin-dependent oxidoreductase [Saccharothrix xinjiangensis]|uniref:LLM class flavin-dependent oxidoreductase n=1 Tax=Saccharothrix xinjiangensis TaxID=204798 RepID=A0ABV9YEU1_9PSEU